MFTPRDIRNDRVDIDSDGSLGASYEKLRPQLDFLPEETLSALDNAVRMQEQGRLSDDSIIRVVSFSDDFLQIEARDINLISGSPLRLEGGSLYLDSWSWYLPPSGDVILNGLLVSCEIAHCQSSYPIQPRILVDSPGPNAKGYVYFDFCQAVPRLAVRSESYSISVISSGGGVSRLFPHGNVGCSLKVLASNFEISHIGEESRAVIIFGASPNSFRLDNGSRTIKGNFENKQFEIQHIYDEDGEYRGSCYPMQVELSPESGFAAGGVLLKPDGNFVYLDPVIDKVREDGVASGFGSQEARILNQIQELVPNLRVEGCADEIDLALLKSALEEIKPGLREPLKVVRVREKLGKNFVAEVHGPERVVCVTKRVISLRVVSHEVTHIYEASLKPRARRRLMRRWEKMAGGASEYGRYLELRNDRHVWKAQYGVDDSAPMFGFVCSSGCFNPEEDRATFVESVYMDRKKFKKLLDPANSYATRAIGKLWLLRKHGFITEDEYQGVLRQSGFHKIWQSWRPSIISSVISECYAGLKSLRHFYVKTMRYFF